MKLKTWIVILLLMSSTIYTSSVVAQSHGQALSLKYENKEGVWFPEGLAKDILADVKIKKLLDIKLDLLSNKLKLVDDRISVLREIIVQKDIIIASKEEQLLSAIDERDLARKEIKRWYRNPAFLVISGVMGTVLIELLVFKGMTAMQ